MKKARVQIPQLLGHGSATRNIALSLEQEAIPITSDGTMADPGWRFTDAAGHRHGQLYSATMTRVVDDSFECFTCDSEPHLVESTHWECSTCGEVIRPGTIPAGQQTYVRGLQTATLEAESYDDDHLGRIRYALYCNEDDMHRLRSVPAADLPEVGWDIIDTAMAAQDPRLTVAWGAR